MPKNPIPSQSPEQFSYGQPSPPKSDRALILWGIAAGVVIGGILIVVMMLQRPAGIEEVEQIPASPTPSAVNPVQEVSEGTTISDIQADLNALEQEIVLPDLDEETQSLEQETEGF